MLKYRVHKGAKMKYKVILEPQEEGGYTVKVLVKVVDIFGNDTTS